MIKKVERLNRWFLHWHSELNGGYGHMSFSSWQQAMDKAEQIEKERVWLTSNIGH